MQAIEQKSQADSEKNNTKYRATAGIEITNADADAATKGSDEQRRANRYR
jgi:hypothetical protein